MQGLLPGRQLPDSEIEAWLTKRIPSVRSQTLENSEFKNIKLTFELGSRVSFRLKLKEESRPRKRP